MPENTAANQAIGNAVAAEDPDTGATLTYTLGGTDASSFDFDTSTGQLKTKAALNKETKDTYSVTVSVTDGKADDGTIDTTADQTIMVIINVTDANEAPVVSGSTAVDYPENGVGPVHTYTATNPEGAKIEWSLDGDGKDLFEISNTGELTFKSSPDHDVPGDKDENNVYLVTVKASDGANTVALTWR